jgi:hypothetical protein
MSAKPCPSVVPTGPQTAFLEAEAARPGITTLGELVRRIVDQHREAKRDRTS